MHDLLFENQKRWSSFTNPTSIITNFAREIGLDVNSLKISEFRGDPENGDGTKAGSRQQKCSGLFYLWKKVEQLPKNY